MDAWLDAFKNGLNLDDLANLIHEQGKPLNVVVLAKAAVLRQLERDALRK